MTPTTVQADALRVDALDVVTRRARRPATFRQAFRVRDFRALFAADVLSLLGSQVAAVAVTTLVYERSHSPLLAAAGYATGYLPWVLGGPLLAAWAERLPGRRVMIGADLARAGLIGLAALPGTPTGLLCVLVFAAALLSPAFTAARSGVQQDVLPGDLYPAGLGVLNISHQAGQLLGFAGGGALVLLISAPGALLLDALSFLLSAAVLSAGLTRTAPATDGAPADRSTTLWHEAIEGLAVVLRDRRLIGPLLLCVVGTAYGIVPEAVAAALAASLGHGASGVGVLLAAAAAGSIGSDVVVVRLIRPGARQRLMRPMALAGAVPLMLVGLLPAAGLDPGFGGSVALIATAGLGTGFVVTAQSAFARAVPAAARVRAFGVAGASLYAGQSLAILAAGAAAELFSARSVIAGAGCLGAVGVVLAGRLLRLVHDQPAAGVSGRPARTGRLADRRCSGSRRRGR